MSEIDDETYRMLRTHVFFEAFSDEQLRSLVEVGQELHLSPGEFVFREGDPARSFYVIERGSVALELASREKSRTIMTLGSGDVLGVSWLFAPRRWMFDAHVLSPVEIVALDTQALMERCEQDPELGYQVIKHIAQAMLERLQATRVQLLDLYAH